MPITSLDFFLEEFHRAYLRRKAYRQYPTQLPLEIRGYQISEVQTNKGVSIVLSHPVLMAIGARKEETFRKSQHDKMPDDIDEIVKYFQLGEVVRIWETRLDELIGHADPWATELADEHIDNPRPSFMIAMTRMGRAYSKLFELEQSLRFFIEQALKTNDPNDWWSQVPKGVRDRAEGREARPTNKWLEDYSTVKLRFTELDDLRLIVIDNGLWSEFRRYFENKDLFNGIMQDLSRPRHRIAHVNTLSADDTDKFIQDAEKILKLVRPHIQLP